MKTIRYLKHERIRVLFQSLLRGFKPESCLSIRGAYKSEIHIAGKTVLSQLIFLPFHSVS